MIWIYAEVVISSTTSNFIVLHLCTRRGDIGICSVANFFFCGIAMNKILSCCLAVISNHVMFYILNLRCLVKKVACGPFVMLWYIVWHIWLTYPCWVKSVKIYLHHERMFSLSKKLFRSFKNQRTNIKLLVSVFYQIFSWWCSLCYFFSVALWC